MAYVDLYPVRAGMSKTLQDSEFTSLYERIHGKACDDDNGAGQIAELVEKPLFGF